MTFVKGNQWWRQRAKHGRDKIFETPAILWESCCEYFDMVEEHPIWSMKATQYQGAQVDMTVPKARAMTISGLCIFLDIDEDTWALYRARPDFIGIVGKVEKIIYNQKLSGAAADEFNANIIARELGLTDKQEMKQSININISEKDAEL